MAATFIILKINVKTVYWQISSINDFISELHYLDLQINSVNSQFTNLPAWSVFAALSCFTSLKILNSQSVVNSNFPTKSLCLHNILQKIS